MSQNSITFKKAKAFAIRIVNLYKYLCAEKREYVLSKQLVRCGTSIGANLAEAICGISMKDFTSKIYISLKECAETKYWLDLLCETNYLTKSEYESIVRDCTELIKLLTATAKTSSNNLKSNL